MRKYEEGMLSTFELRTSANALLESRVKLLQMHMLYAMKQRLVDYYKGEIGFVFQSFNLITSLPLPRTSSCL